MYMYTQGHSRIVSSGTHLPDARITAREMLEQIDAPNRFGVSLDWIERVSGIHENAYRQLTCCLQTWLY